ncbi:MAG: 4-hydroxythreonine-4-phosphate dehydrogenase PdxA [Candidatus Omnitrophota bacterium]
MPTSRSNKPSLAITMGDPSGVGPEVTLKSLASPRVLGLADFLVIGDRFVIDRCKIDLGLDLKADLLDLSNVPRRSFSYGKVSPVFGRASMQYIDAALDVIARRRAGGLITAPINKTSVKAAGFKNFQGHTEYLAQETGIEKFAMLFVGPALKVALVTRHIPLKRVAEELNKDAVYNAISLTHRYLKRYFRLKAPRIGVMGLNPHAGEGGSFGDEEKSVISPAIRRASRSIKNIFGPLPADTAFHDALDKKYDALVAMYHDQALTAFKALYFNNGVNMTLGLPFIRTSPDHGTAFDIAGGGAANPESMIEAIILAARLASRK